MNKQQTWTLCLILSIAVLINLTGEFLIHNHFNQKLSNIIPLEDTQILKADQLTSITKSTDIETEMSPFTIQTVSAEKEIKTAKTNSEPENETKLDQPAKLNAKIEAAPIKSNNEKWLKELIKKELPESSQEEQEIWLEELSDMPLRAARDLLMMRNKMGTFPIETELFSQKNEILPEKTAKSPVPLQPMPSNLKHQSMIRNSIKSMNSATKIILNNIANANTNGFKRTEPLFSTLPYVLEKINHQSSACQTPLNLSTGMGSYLSGSKLDFSQGDPRQTNSQLDIMISGEGFFAVTDGTDTFYTRDGAFTINADGNILLASSNRSLLLEPTINVPANTTDINISSDGIIAVLQSGSTATTEIGHIQISRFSNPNGLIPQGWNLYAETASSGTANTSTPNSNGAGKIIQSYLEESNVNLADEKLKLQQYKQTIHALEEASRILAQ